MEQNRVTPTNEELTERVKKLEYLLRNTRIAIIIIVGYGIYDVISRDSGSDIVFAHKVKAKQFELVDGAGTILGGWKVQDKDAGVAELVVENSEGKQLRLSADKVSFVSGRVNSVETLVINEEGLNKPTYSPSAGE